MKVSFLSSLLIIASLCWAIPVIGLCIGGHSRL